MIILDTNVISEIQKPIPDPAVMAWLDAQEPSNLYVTSITAEELLFGAFILPEGERKGRLVGTIQNMLEQDFAGRVLPYDGQAALFYALRVSFARSKGVTIGHADGQIAGIILAQKEAKLATRDTAPFEAMRVEVINPWDYRT